MITKIKESKAKSYFVDAEGETTIRNTVYAEYMGLSTDAKPTDCGNGSTFTEIDEKKTYIYDAENEDWLEQ